MEAQFEDWLEVTGVVEFDEFVTVVEEDALGTDGCSVFNAVPNNLLIRMFRAIRAQRSLRRRHIHPLRVRNKLKHCEVFRKSGGAGGHSDVAAGRTSNLGVFDDVVEAELATGVAAAEEPGTVDGIVEEVGANWALHDFYYWFGRPLLKYCWKTAKSIVSKSPSEGGFFKTSSRSI